MAAVQGQDRQQVDQPPAEVDPEHHDHEEPDVAAAEATSGERDRSHDAAEDDAGERPRQCDGDEVPTRGVDAWLPVGEATKGVQVDGG